MPPRRDSRVDVDVVPLFILFCVFGVTEGRVFCAQDAARGKGAIGKYQSCK